MRRANIPPVITPVAWDFWLDALHCSLKQIIYTTTTRHQELYPSVSPASSFSPIPNLVLPPRPCLNVGFFKDWCPIGLRFICAMIFSVVRSWRTWCVGTGVSKDGDPVGPCFGLDLAFCGQRVGYAESTQRPQPIPLYLQPYPNSDDLFGCLQALLMEEEAFQDTVALLRDCVKGIRSQCAAARKDPSAVASGKCLRFLEDMRNALMRCTPQEIPGLLSEASDSLCPVTSTTFLPLLECPDEAVSSTTASIITLMAQQGDSIHRFQSFVSFLGVRCKSHIFLFFFFAVCHVHFF